MPTTIVYIAKHKSTHTHSMPGICLLVPIWQLPSQQQPLGQWVAVSKASRLFVEEGKGVIWVHKTQHQQAINIPCSVNVCIWRWNWIVVVSQCSDGSGAPHNNNNNNKHKVQHNQHLVYYYIAAEYTFKSRPENQSSLCVYGDVLLGVMMIIMMITYYCEWRRARCFDSRICNSCLSCV